MRLIVKNKVSTGNADTMSAMEKLWDNQDSVRKMTVKQRDVKAWKATHFGSETESLQVNNRSRRGHMNTVTGKGSLEIPVNGEDSLRVDQLNHFEQVLGNSMATSEERLEQLKRVGCRATRGMPTATGSTAAENGWRAAQRSSLRSTAHDRSSARFVPRITSNATITRNVRVKCSRKHSTQAFR